MGSSMRTRRETDTLEQLTREGRVALCQSPSPGLDAQLLLAHVLGRSRAYVLAHGPDVAPPHAVEGFRRLIAHRQEGEPVAYLTGRRQWFGLDLEVGRDVLIPRPDTEILAEEAIRLARRREVRLLADVGTGSGALAIALALALPLAKVLAADREAAALDVARRNAQLHGVWARITFLQGDLLQPVQTRPDLLVANLPYLSDAMMAQLDREVRHEPVSALHGGPTGLELYQRLFDQLAARDWMLPVLFEIDPRQADAARALVQRHWPQAHLRVLPDLAGLDRVVVAEP